MAVVRFKFTSPVSGNTVPAVGDLWFEPTARRVIVGDPDNIVLPIPFSASLVNGTLDVDLAQTGPDWVWKVTERIHGRPATSYHVAVPSGAGPIDAPDLVKVNPGDYTPIDTTKNVSLAELDSRVDALEAGGGGTGGGAVSSVNSKTGDVVLNAADVGAAPASHTHTAAQISDSTATGRAVVTAADAAAARTAIGAGTSNLAIGTTGTTAAAGNDSRLSDARTPTAHTHNASDVNAGVLAVARLGSGTPAAGKYVDGGTGAWTTLPAGGGGASSYAGAPQSGGYMVYPSGDVSTLTLFGFTYFVPMFLPEALSLQEVAVEVTTAAASSVLKIGYYTMDSTGTLNLGATFSTTLDASTTGIKAATGSWTLPAGVVWLGIGWTGAQCTVRAASRVDLPGPIFTPNATTGMQSAANLIRGAGQIGDATITPTTDGPVAAPKFRLRKA